MVFPSPSTIKDGLIKAIRSVGTKFVIQIIAAIIIDLSTNNAKSIQYTTLSTSSFPPKTNIECNGQLVGTCEVTFSNHFITSQVQETTLAVGLLLIALVIVESIMILFLVNRNISTPLNSLVSVAKSVSQGDIRPQSYSLIKKNTLSE